MSLKRKSLGFHLISKLNPVIKERLLNYPISSDALQKFDEEEKRDHLKAITDLRDLSSKSETEVYSTLNLMCKNKQFFMYCGPLLLNINPGPNSVNDYLNLHAWVKENQNKPENQWKPHLYSFVYYVYKTLVEENKDQVVNMLGQIGSGKTFNIVHIIEYFCCMVGPEGQQTEVFDVIHRSIQLIHIMGSIFRQNNIESTSCGMLLRLGFNEENKLCTFDLEAKILDLTLPFSENGRSFSILHSLMTGASNDMKRLLELPENEANLNFFRKFLQNFNINTKERFRFNDLEIWNRFHSLLSTFKFSKQEIIEILQIFSFILLCNEASIGKIKSGKMTEYTIIKGLSSKKLAKNIGMSEDEFLKKFGTYKDVQEIKNSLIIMMKYSYYMVFEFIKTKVKNHLKIFFEQVTGVNANDYHSFSNTNTSNVKYINFLDFPGEVDEQTLGGFSTQYANECLNVFAGANYLSVVEKLMGENLNLKYFQPLHSYSVIQSMSGKDGFFNFLSRPFTEENFKRLKSLTRSKEHFLKTVIFNDNITSSKNEFLFNFKFSHKTVAFNYESLYLETQSLLITPRLIKLFEASKNSVIRLSLKSAIDKCGNIYSLTLNNLKTLFEPLEALHPFVIYCLHSNNSYRLFFGEDMMESSPDWVIPKELTISMLKNSLMIPVLHWEWFGYHEWTDADNFVKEFATDFDKLKDSIVQIKSSKQLKNISFNNMNSYEISKYILSIIGKEKEYVFGASHILLKKGSLQRIRRTLDHMADIVKTGALNGRKSVRRKSSKSLYRQTSYGMKSSSSLKTQSKKSIPTLASLIKKDPTVDVSPISKKEEKFVKDTPYQRRYTMKVQCHLNLIDNMKSPRKSEGQRDLSGMKYNLFTILNDIQYENPEKKSCQYSSGEMLNNDGENYKRYNNIIIPNKNYFNIFQNLFDYSKIENFNIFDYQENIQEIMKIQSAFRAAKARKKYKIFRYAVRKIIQIQTIFRGFIIKKKFRKFLKCYKCIVYIQLFYKYRHRKRVRSAIHIQSAWRELKGYDREINQNGDQIRKNKENFEKEISKVSNKNQGKQGKNEFRGGIGMSIAELEVETDKEKIIQHLLLDHTLSKENSKSSRALMNSEGLSEIRRQISQTSCRKDQPKGKRIEDKLIEYGESMKIKKAKTRLEKLKQEEGNYSFKPNINIPDIYLTKHKQIDFLKRTEMYKQIQDLKLEEMRQNIVDPNQAEYIFKPKLSSLANSMKRDISDLYHWKMKRDKEVERMKQLQDEQENEKIEKSKMATKMSQQSKEILREKYDKNLKEQMSCQEEAYDLWPTQFEKQYYQK